MDFSLSFLGRVVTKRVQGLGRAHWFSCKPFHLHHDEDLPVPPRLSLPARDLLAVCRHQLELQHLLLPLHAGDKRQDCGRDKEDICKEIKFLVKIL